MFGCVGEGREFKCPSKVGCFINYETMHWNVLDAMKWNNLQGVSWEEKYQG